MYELHITPKQDFVEDFLDIAQRFKFKIIRHWNYDRNFKPLYLEMMISEKCKDISELNQKLELMLRTAKHHNLARIKVESKINDDFSFNVPYKMGSNYFEVHIDINIEELVEKNKISELCGICNAAISKSTDKNSYMLTIREANEITFKFNMEKALSELQKIGIKPVRILKEYAFLDDNLSLDNPWLETYR